MRHIAANGLNLLIAVLLVVLGIIGWGVSAFRGAGPLQQETIVVLDRGDSLPVITEKLEQDGAISNGTIFRIGARYTKTATTLKFGEYAIPAGASMEDILAILSSGKSILHPITIPEGFTSFQVVQRLDEADFLSGEITTVPPEGMLAPDTYNLQRGTPRQTVIDQMMAAQKRILAAAWEGRQADLPLDTPEEALVLASIVEKETGIPGERPEVASVFINRLRAGMRLETDPTVIYGITGGKEVLDRGLRRSELQTRTPYNTYMIDGLPPTPIANPGRAAIAAVMQPAKTDYLFFVADGSGGHVFSSTLREHNRNVAEWRRIERQRQSEQN
ncbi:endolytic transglycosylase MltG [Paroceanicella profunda]|uniref:Endolytic murein transglycosylase n=1 Tax=Paroceanicella profunda TaxID=2579971 RepID=A0A5B8FIH9_9RHOB|nr:endolytic transglycosylase MltG [Paroceanicella profunda]QDL93088.1 endolytic transglycosylase MltG [Paroceanicella profunda]